MTSPASSQTDLFGASGLPGLDTLAGILSPDEASTLIDHIDAAGLSPFRFQGWTGKRLTRSFGWLYDFDLRRFDLAEPIPSWLSPLRARAARFAGLEEAALVQALVTRYDVGAGIGWHRDRPVFDQVIGISLGSPAVMRFRRRRDDGGFDRFRLPLDPGGAYRLSGEARYGWEHSIAPMEQPRWSITFRSLAQT